MVLPAPSNPKITILMVGREMALESESLQPIYNL